MFINKEEAMDLVRKAAETKGLNLTDFDCTPTYCPAGSMLAELSPWPREDSWCIGVTHHILRSGLIDCGGSIVSIRCATGEVRWDLLP